MKPTLPLLITRLLAPLALVHAADAPVKQPNNHPLEEHNRARDAMHAATLAKMSARCDELHKALR